MSGAPSGPGSPTDEVESNAQSTSDQSPVSPMRWRTTDPTMPRQQTNTTLIVPPYTGLHNQPVPPQKQCSPNSIVHTPERRWSRTEVVPYLCTVMERRALMGRGCHRTPQTYISSLYSTGRPRTPTIETASFRKDASSGCSQAPAISHEHECVSRRGRAWTSPWRRTQYS